MTTPPDRKARAARPSTDTGSMRAWRAQLRSAKGAIVQVHLGQTAATALQAMAGKRGKGPLIERLILDEHRRRSAAKKSGEADER